MNLATGRGMGREWRRPRFYQTSGRHWRGVEALLELGPRWYRHETTRGARECDTMSQIKAEHRSTAPFAPLLCARDAADGASARRGVSKGRILGEGDATAKVRAASGDWP